ncbi:hypothetical protein F511_15784 [Dorcoceras hygrometricum]|nr:hypothetical protein F511_15784 [Dorcoceras hygrometricum]
MGCLGQARTKPRRKNQPPQRCRRRRRTASATNIARGAWPHACRNKCGVQQALRPALCCATFCAWPMAMFGQPAAIRAASAQHQPVHHAASARWFRARHSSRATVGRRRTRRRPAACTCVTLNGSGIQLAVGPQPLRLRNHNFGLAHRIIVKRLATSPHDPLSITDSACKNQLVVVSVQYGPFNTYITIRSTTIGKSRVAIDPIAMHTSWRSNSDITSVTR